MKRADVLLVDDEPGIRTAIVRALEQGGDLRVEAVGNPGEAIERLEVAPPRVLLTDYRMPVVNGLEVLRAARQLAPDTIRVLLTGEADRAHIIDAINEGRIFRFVPKPWDNAQLRAVVHEALSAFEDRRADHARRHTLEAASAVQRACAPARPQRGEAAFFVSPHEYASGDYVDALDIPGGRTALILGDVCGHGVGAALYVMAARAVFRTGLAEGDDPAQVLQRVNRHLSRDMCDGRFMTLFLGIHDPARQGLWYVNAGQTPPLLLAGGEVHDLSGTSLPLGLDATARYANAREVALGPADTLLAFTDGITEARAPDGELFGMGRVADTLRAAAGRPLASLLTDLQAGVYAFTGRGGVGDDLTALAFRPEPALVAGCTSVNEY